MARTTGTRGRGPLAGMRIIEMAGIGPVPFCGMLLADMGATVVRVDRPSNARLPMRLHRGRKSIAIDLKKPGGTDLVLRLIGGADGVIEGFRPGVMERLGLGPDRCLEINPRLVFGRCTGWGQDGPLAMLAGHDINYIAITGALAAIGAPESGPVAPLNLVGDFGGGAMLLATGVLAALVDAQRSGKGQVVDAAMTDGASLLMTMMYEFKHQGRWSNQRATNILDGGAPFYGCYECADGKWVAVGAIEKEFRKDLADAIGLPGLVRSDDAATWPGLKAEVAAVFRTRTRDEWVARLDGFDACFAPILDLDEAPSHPHNVARGTFYQLPDGTWMPAPAPRFSGSAGAAPLPAGDHPGDSTDAILGEFGISAAEAEQLAANGVVAKGKPDAK